MGRLDAAATVDDSENGARDRKAPFSRWTYYWKREKETSVVVTAKKMAVTRQQTRALTVSPGMLRSTSGGNGASMPQYSTSNGTQCSVMQHREHLPCSRVSQEQNDKRVRF